MCNISARAQTLVRTSPSLVYEAFVDAGTMSKFWFTRRDDGLKAGETVSWFIGEDKEAFAIKVRVIELKKPERILIEWGDGDEFTHVLWKMEETADGHTKLVIEESGFAGSAEEVTIQALDSTRGFNQVIIALKALVEHGVAINVVADHV